MKASPFRDIVACKSKMLAMSYYQPRFVRDISNDLLRASAILLLKTLLCLRYFDPPFTDNRSTADFSRIFAYNAKCVC
jgi:hypothetical protein